MKIAYDPKTDTLAVTLKEHVAIAESDEGKEGVILDYDAGGDLVSVEIPLPSTRVTDTSRVEFQAVE